jgi:hypothetical protein
MPGGEEGTAGGIGNVIRHVLKESGLPHITAHDLRAAFASALISAWWLKYSVTVYRPFVASQQSWTRQLLIKFGRPSVEGRAVEFADDLRRLLGHASLEVTFERYVHLMDLVVADCISLAEREEHPLISTGSAAALVGVSSSALRQFIPKEKRTDPLQGGRAPTVSLKRVEPYLIQRICRG